MSCWGVIANIESPGDDGVTVHSDDSCLVKPKLGLNCSDLQIMLTRRVQTRGTVTGLKINQSCQPVQATGLSMNDLRVGDILVHS